ncbi:MAG TPA: hypothetical protein VKU01_08525 [Bryobacteraceae bacterium]|nr:hypothetical protein [Bryobacteraceae bacterium]
MPAGILSIVVFSDPREHYWCAVREFGHEGQSPAHRLDCVP